jgi:hypothetical protein
MNLVAPSTELSADQQRRAVRLGLVLGGVSLALTAAFFILFSHFGLPKDPKVWKRMQQRESAAAPQPSVDKESAR